MLVSHCCDNVAVVIQSITSYCALLSSRFLSPFLLGVYVCVCGVTGTGCDCDREAVWSWRLGGRDRGEGHSGAIDVVAAPGPRHGPTLVHVLVCVGVRVRLFSHVGLC